MIVTAELAVSGPGGLTLGLPSPSGGQVCRVQGPAQVVVVAARYKGCMVPLGDKPG